MSTIPEAQDAFGKALLDCLEGREVQQFILKTNDGTSIRRWNLPGFSKPATGDTHGKRERWMRWEVTSWIWGVAWEIGVSRQHVQIY